MATTYRISDLAREFDLTPRAMRFYEDLGLLRPERTGPGGRQRVYSSRDRTRLKLTLRAKRLGLSLAEARAIIDALGHPQLRLMPDFFHMNVEEGDIAAGLRAHAAVIGHLHLADSNRQLPSEGHTNWAAAFAALREVGYQGALAIECKPPADPHTAFPAALRLLRSL